MASAFNLTAQLNLRGPSNINQIASDIRKQLGTINGDVNLKVNAQATKNITQLNSALKILATNLNQVNTNASSAASAISAFANAANSINRATSSTATNITKTVSAVSRLTQAQNTSAQSAKKATSEIEEFGKQSALAVRRFAAFSSATTVIFGLTNALRKGIGAFIEFEKEFVKVQQVTDKTGAELGGLEKEITRLSTSLGVSSSELIRVSSTLAQAGLNARDTQKAMQALALTDLAPSFDSLNDTVEGSIALMRQFNIGAGQLEKALGSINSVAAAFAVESSDLIAAIQRTGGVFASASKGVSDGTQALNEFLAVFTSVRQTTRESAETIATGLRTIFTRIQREDTIEALREYGISLTDLDGKFVGAYKAVELLSQGLGKLDPRDLRFSQIVEELGGFRQIGKVIPLIQQFTVAQQALGVAQRGQGSLAKDAVTAQISLANQMAKVREEFLALTRSIGGSDTFQTLASGALGFASGLIKVADSIKGVLPILAILGAGKAANAIGKFSVGFLGGIKKSGGDGGDSGGGGSLINSRSPSPGTNYSLRDLNLLDDLLRSNTDAITKLSNNLATATTSLASITSLSAALQSNVTTVASNTTSLNSLTQAIQNMSSSMTGTSDIATAIRSSTDTLYSSMVDLIVVMRDLSNDVKDLNSRGGGGSTGLNSGGIVRKFARGGVVPGSGNSDTVPAMLMPGEFVIRKKAVETIGANNLHAMNKYGGGGSIRSGRTGKRQGFAKGGAVKIASVQGNKKAKDGDTFYADVLPAADKFTAEFRINEWDAYETSGSSKITKKKWEEIKQFNKGIIPSNIILRNNKVSQSTVSIPPETKVAPDLTAQEAANAATNSLQNKLKKLGNQGVLDSIIQGQSELYNRFLATSTKGLDIPEKYKTGRKFNTGGKIQKFMDGGLVEQGGNKYLESDVIKAMSEAKGVQLSREEAIKEFLRRNEDGDWYYTHWGIPGKSQKPPKWLAPYREPDALDRVQGAMMEKQDRIAEWKRKKGLGSSEYEGKSQEEKTFLRSRGRYAYGGLVQKFMAGGKAKETRPFGSGDFPFPKRISNAYFKEIDAILQKEQAEKAFSGGLGYLEYPSEKRIRVDSARAIETFDSTPLDRASFAESFKKRASALSIYKNMSNFAKLIGLPREDLSLVLPESIEFTKLGGLGPAGQFDRTGMGKKGIEAEGYDLSSLGFGPGQEQDLYGYEKLVAEKQKEIKKILKTPVKTFDDGSFRYDEEAAKKTWDEINDLQLKIMNLKSTKMKAQASVRDQIQATAAQTGRGTVSLNTGGLGFAKNDTFYHELTHQLFQGLRTRSAESFDKYKERVVQLFGGDNDQLADAFDALENSYNSADVVYGRSYKIGALDQIIQQNRSLNRGSKPAQTPEAAADATKFWAQSLGIKKARDFKPINPDVNKTLLNNSISQSYIDRIEDSGKEEFLTTLIQNANRLDPLLQGTLDSTLNDLLGSAGITRQKYAEGGRVERKIGIIDTDMLRDPANAGIVGPAMEKLGLTNVSEYSRELGRLSVRARKDKSLSKLISIAGAPGSGKSSIATGRGATDDATLRKTTRSPVLTPDDIAKFNEIIVLTSTASEEKLDAYLRDVDRAYILSSSTESEQERVRLNREKRDLTGEGLYGRPPGTTTTASRDFTLEESILRDELGSKAMVLGRRGQGFGLRRKRESELPEIVQAGGFYTGGFSPPTRGHRGAFDTLLGSMIARNPSASAEDIILSIAPNLPMDRGEGKTEQEKLEHAARYGIFPADFRKLLAQINFPTSMISTQETPQGNVLPPMMEVEGVDGRRRFAKLKGALAITSGKKEGALDKYGRAGMKVTDIPRIDDISATEVRKALFAGDDATLMKFLNPEVASVLMGNRAQLRNRSVMVPMLIEEIKKYGAVQKEQTNSEIQKILADAPGGPYSRITKKARENAPDVVAQVERMRKERDQKAEGLLGYRAHNIVSLLSAKYPDAYGLDISRRAQVSAKPADLAKETISAQIAEAMGGEFGTMPTLLPSSIQQAILEKVTKETAAPKGSGALPTTAKEVLAKLGDRVLPTDPKFGEFSGKSIRDTAKGGKLGYWMTKFPATLATKPEKLAAYEATRDYIKGLYSGTATEATAQALATRTTDISQSTLLAMVGLYGKNAINGPLTWNLGKNAQGEDVTMSATIMERVLPEQYKSVADYISSQTDITVANAAKMLGKKDPKKLSEKQKGVLNQGNIEGGILEQLLAVLGGDILDDAVRTRAIDFPSGIGPFAASIFDIPDNIPTEAKRTISSDSRADAIEEFQRHFRGIYGIPEPQKLASGGKVDPLLEKYKNIIASIMPPEFIGKNGLLKLPDGTEQQTSIVRQKPDLIQRALISMGIDKPYASFLGGDYTSKYLYALGQHQDLFDPEDYKKLRKTVESSIPNTDTITLATGAEPALSHETFHQISSYLARYYPDKYGKLRSATDSKKDAILDLIKSTQVKSNYPVEQYFPSDPTKGLSRYRSQAVQFAKSTPGAEGIAAKAWNYGSADEALAQIITLKDEFNNKEAQRLLSDILSEAGLSQVFAAQKFFFGGKVDPLAKKYGLSQKEFLAQKKISDAMGLGSEDFELKLKLFASQKQRLKGSKLDAEQALNDVLKSQKFAKGGSAQDTVPALLTPGEFVINRESAKKIGYGKLAQLNQADKIQGFNKGGFVGVQKFALGGVPTNLSSDATSYFRTQAEYFGVTFNNYLKDLQKQILTKTLQFQKDIPSSINRFRARSFELRGAIQAGAAPGASDEDKAKGKDAVDELTQMLKDTTGSLDTARIDGAISNFKNNLNDTSMSFDSVYQNSIQLNQMFREASDKGNILQRVLGDLNEATGVAVQDLQKIASVSDVLAADKLQKLRESADRYSKALALGAGGLVLFTGVVNRFLEAEKGRSSQMASAALGEGSAAVGSALALGSTAISNISTLASNAGGPGMLGTLGGVAAKILPVLLNPVTLAAAALGTAVFGVAAAMKGAANAARAFDKAVASENVDRSIEGITRAFDDFSKDIKNTQILQDIDRQLSFGISNAIANAKIDIEVPKVFWVNLIDSLSQAEGSSDRSRILEKKGVGAYFESSTYGQSGILGKIGAMFGLMGLAPGLYSGAEKRANEARSSYIGQLAPDQARQQSEYFKGLSDNLLKNFEQKLRTGTNFDDVLKQLGSSNAPTPFAEAIARANPAIEEWIIRIRANTQLTDAQKDSQIKQIIATEAYNKTLLNLTATVRELELDKLNKATRNYITSIERMFSNMDKALAKTTYELENLSRGTELANSALSGTAKAGTVSLSSINVLQNQNAYSANDRNIAISQAGEMFGPAGNIVRSLIAVSRNLEDTVLSTINRVKDRDATASPEKIAGAVRSALNISLNDIGLPSDLSRKMSEQVQLAFSEIMAKGDKTVSFDQLVEKVPALSNAVDSARAAQERAVKSLEYWQKNLNDYAEAMNVMVDQQIEINSRLNKAADIEIKGLLELDKAFGKSIPLTRLGEISRGETARLTGGPTNPQDIQRNILRLEEIRASQQASADFAANKGVGGRDEFRAMENRLRLTNTALRDNYTALKNMAESADLTSAALGKINEQQQKNQAGVSFIEKLVTSDGSELDEFGQALARLNVNMAGGTTNSTAEERSQTLQAFNMIAPLLGEQQNQLKANMLEAMLKESGIGVSGFSNQILNSLRNPEGDPAMQEAIRVYKDALELQKQANTSLADIYKVMQNNTQEMANEKLVRGFKEVMLSFEQQTLADIAKKIQKLIDIMGGAPAAVNKALGGVIYAQSGTAVKMTPKGTDTVPAMLTPGEFVVNKAATQKNLPLLQNINSGTKYYAAGGVVSVDGIGVNKGKWTDPSYDPSKTFTNRVGDKGKVTADKYSEITDLNAAKTFNSMEQVYRTPLSYYAANSTDGPLGEPFLYARNVKTSGPDASFSNGNLIAVPGISYNSMRLGLRSSNPSITPNDPLSDFQKAPIVVGQVPKLDELNKISPILEKTINIPEKDVGNYILAYKNLINNLSKSENVQAVIKKKNDNETTFRNRAGAYFRGNTELVPDPSKDAVSLNNLSITYPDDFGFLYKNPTNFSTVSDLKGILSFNRVGFGGRKAQVAAGISSLNSNFATFVNRNSRDFDSPQPLQNDIIEQASRATKLKNDYENDLTLLNKNSSKFIASEEALINKNLAAKLEYLYEGLIFKAQFGRELFKDRSAEGIDLPLILYNTNKESWKNKPDLFDAPDEQKGKLFAWYDSDFIKLQSNQPGSPERLFPWTSAKFDSGATFDKLASEFAPGTVPVSVQRGLVYTDDSKNLNIPYTKVKAQYFNEELSRFDGPLQEYIAIERSPVGFPGSPFMDMPTNFPLLWPESIDNLVKFLEPGLDKPGHEYKFDGINSGQLKVDDPYLRSILDNDPTYRNLGDLQKFVVAQNELGTKNLYGINFRSPQFDKLRAEGKAKLLERKADIDTGKVVGAGDFVLGANESFSDAKRVTFARAFYDMVGGVKSAKPTNISGVQNISDELNSQLRGISLKSGTDSPEYARIDAIRAIFNSLSNPKDDIANYFGRLGFSLNNDNFKNPVPPPKDPANPLRSKIDYYQNTNQDLTRNLQLLLQREIDYRRSYSSQTSLGEDLAGSLKDVAESFTETKVSADGTISKSKDKYNIKTYQDIEKIALNPYSTPSKSQDRQKLLDELYSYYKNDVDAKGRPIWPKERYAFIGDSTPFGDLDLFTKGNLIEPKNIREWYAIQDNIINTSKTKENIGQQLDILKNNKNPNYVAPDEINKSRNTAQKFNDYLTGNLYGQLPNAQFLTDWLLKTGVELEEAAKKASGGIVYASTGKYIDFKPKGTDTIPAMLTPGEFVINKSATEKHLPLLQKINKGEDVLYRATGSKKPEYSRGAGYRAQSSWDSGPSQYNWDLSSEDNATVNERLRRMRRQAPSQSGATDLDALFKSFRENEARRVAQTNAGFVPSARSVSAQRNREQIDRANEYVPSGRSVAARQNREAIANNGFPAQPTRANNFNPWTSVGPDPVFGGQAKRATRADAYAQQGARQRSADSARAWTTSTPDPVFGGQPKRATRADAYAQQGARQRSADSARAWTTSTPDPVFGGQPSGYVPSARAEAAKRNREDISKRGIPTQQKAPQTATPTTQTQGFGTGQAPPNAGFLTVSGTNSQISVIDTNTINPQTNQPKTYKGNEYPQSPTQALKASDVIDFNAERLWYGGRLWDLNNDGKEAEKIFGSINKILDPQRVMINTKGVPGGLLILRNEYMTKEDLSLVDAFKNKGKTPSPVKGPSLSVNNDRIWYGGKLWDQNNDGKESPGEVLSGKLDSILNNGDVRIIRSNGRSLLLDNKSFKRFATKEDMDIVKGMKPDYKNLGGLIYAQNGMYLGNNQTFSLGRPIRNNPSLTVSASGSSRLAAPQRTSQKQGFGTGKAPKNAGLLTTSGTKPIIMATDLNNIDPRTNKPMVYGPPGFPSLERSGQVPPPPQIDKITAKDVLDFKTSRVWYGGKLWDQNRDGRETPNEKLVGYLDDVAMDGDVRIIRDKDWGYGKVLRLDPRNFAKYSTPEDQAIVKAWLSSGKKKSPAAFADGGLVYAAEGTLVNKNQPKYMSEGKLYHEPYSDKIEDQIRFQIDNYQNTKWLNNKKWKNKDKSNWWNAIGANDRFANGGSLKKYFEIMNTKDMIDRVLDPSAIDWRDRSSGWRSVGGIGVTDASVILDDIWSNNYQNPNSPKKADNSLWTENDKKTYAEYFNDVSKLRINYEQNEKRKQELLRQYQEEVPNFIANYKAEKIGTLSLEKDKKITPSLMTSSINPLDPSSIKKMEDIELGNALISQFGIKRLIGNINGQDQGEAQAYFYGLLEKVIPGVLGTVAAGVGLALAAPVLPILGVAGAGATLASILVGATAGYAGENVGKFINGKLYNALDPQTQANIAKTVENNPNSYENGRWTGWGLELAGGVTFGGKIEKLLREPEENVIRSMSSQNLKVVPEIREALYKGIEEKAAARGTNLSSVLKERLQAFASELATDRTKAAPEWIGENFFFGKYNERPMTEEEYKYWYGDKPPQQNNQNENNAPINLRNVEALNKGGMVYASTGKLIDWKPKGTDTVPAMLTPGEFVVNKAATEKHLPLLKKINSGTNYKSNGGIVYLQNGGRPKAVQMPENANELDMTPDGPDDPDRDWLSPDLAARGIKKRGAQPPANLRAADRTTMDANVGRTRYQDWKDRVRAEIARRRMSDDLATSDPLAAAERTAVLSKLPGVDMIDNLEIPDMANQLATKSFLDSKLSDMKKSSRPRGVTKEDHIEKLKRDFLVDLAVNKTVIANKWRITRTDVLDEKGNSVLDEYRKVFADKEKTTKVTDWGNITAQDLQFMDTKTGGPQAYKDLQEFQRSIQNKQFGGIIKPIYRQRGGFPDVVRVLNPADAADVPGRVPLVEPDWLQNFDDAPMQANDPLAGIDIQDIRLRMRAEERPETNEQKLAKLKREAKLRDVGRVGNADNWRQRADFEKRVREAEDQFAKDNPAAAGRALLSDDPLDVRRRQNSNMSIQDFAKQAAVDAYIDEKKRKIFERTLGKTEEDKRKIETSAVTDLSTRLELARTMEKQRWFVQNNRTWRMVDGKKQEVKVAEIRAAIRDKIEQNEELRNSWMNMNFDDLRLLDPKTFKEVSEYKRDGGIIYANNGALLKSKQNGPDTVPAMLTPGEFVVNKQAAQNNLSLLRAINDGSYNRDNIVQKFNRGGQVLPKYYAEGGMTQPNNFNFGQFMQKITGQLSAASINNEANRQTTQQSQQNVASRSNGVSIDSKIFDSIGQLSTKLQGIVESLAQLNNIPSQISLTGSHDVNVIINGDSVLNQLQPEMQDIVMKAVKDGFQKLTNVNYPVPTDRLINPFETQGPTSL